MTPEQELLLEKYRDKKCDVCGEVDEEYYVLYGLDIGDTATKICYRCNYKNWISTFRR